MGFRTIVFRNDFRIDEDVLMDIAEKVAKATLSELPEGIQTYEGGKICIGKSGRKTGNNENYIIKNGYTNVRIVGRLMGSRQ